MGTSTCKKYLISNSSLLISHNSRLHLETIIFMKHTTTQLDFAAKPKVTAVKPKYRDDTRLEGVNLMNDPRVVRGNTYASIV